MGSFNPPPELVDGMAAKSRGSISRDYLTSTAATVLASGLTFVSVPFSIHLIGPESHALLALWTALIVVVPLVDLGVSLAMQRAVLHVRTDTRKRVVLQTYLDAATVVFCILFVLSVFVGLPGSGIYAGLSDAEWFAFKGCLLLNLRMVYFQAALLVTGDHGRFGRLLIGLAVARGFVPPVAWYFFSDFVAVGVFLFGLGWWAESRLMKLLGLVYRCPSKLLRSFARVSGELRLVAALYASSAAAALLGSVDRLAGSSMLSAAAFTAYTSVFLLASCVNLIIQPFYRILVSRLSSQDAEANYHLILRLSIYQSYLALTVVGIVAIFGQRIFTVLLPQVTYDARLGVLFGLSLWAAGNGWLRAYETMMLRVPLLQCGLVLAALSIYAVVLLVADSLSALHLASVWVIHGCIQTFVLPLVEARHRTIERYGGWILRVVILPLSTVGVGSWLISHIVNG
jgi:O-antigen/teichoic acid export membrane protein